VNRTPLSSVSLDMADPLDPTRPHPRRALRALVASALLVLGAAACGSDSKSVDAASGGSTTTTAGTGDDGYGGTTSQGGESEGTYIEAKDFSLTSISVAPGSSVKVENNGSATHTVTADDGAFDSGKIAGGASGSFTAPATPGTYGFHCAIHASMTGTLTVTG
jgi:plastocyanin